MKISLTVLVFTFLVISSRTVDACSCGGHPTSCGSYLAAEAVFIGSVQRVQNSMMKDDDGHEYIAGQIAHVQVERTFKGIKEGEVVFRSGGSSCDAVYKEGQRWLFYAYYDKKSKSWGIRACDRSTRIENAADDLLYLQALPASAEKTRIAGTLSHYEDDPVKGFTRVKNIMGAKVKLTGANKTYETYTDKNGVYEIYDLPPGKYVIDPEIPPGLKVRFPIYYGAVDYSNKQTLKVVLGDKSCAGVNFVFSANTSVGGKVFGADGRVLPNVCVNLMPKDKTAADNWIFDCTDERGRFELDEIPPGEYVIVVNNDGEISSDEPFPTAYYPGVFEKEKATVLAITEGTLLEDYDIHIPAQEITRVIQGVLLYSDGRPVAKAFVEFEADAVKKGYDGEVHTSTDAQGHFSLTVLQGLRGRLRGYMYTYEGEYANCPQLDKLIRAKGGHAHDIGTKPIMLEIDRDVEEIKLTFPFPYCVKAKQM
ncbi:MAG: carboxypeptidase-like regulatory domain-containing protein [Pyrinomonadaceae bacterium]|nr:carboxypeptidase-like regulatory domain-containing protein [Pyrinomonadaceae bacterium]